MSSHADSQDNAFFEGWLSSGFDIWSYEFVDACAAHDDWVEVRAPLPFVDTIHGESSTVNNWM